MSSTNILKERIEKKLLDNLKNLELSIYSLQKDKKTIEDTLVFVQKHNFENPTSNISKPLSILIEEYFYFVEKESSVKNLLDWLENKSKKTNSRNWRKSVYVILSSKKDKFLNVGRGKWRLIA